MSCFVFLRHTIVSVRFEDTRAHICRVMPAAKFNNSSANKSNNGNGDDDVPVRRLRSPAQCDAIDALRRRLMSSTQCLIRDDLGLNAVVDCGQFNYSPDSPPTPDAQRQITVIKQMYSEYEPESVRVM